jgi:hypothetical protein
MLDLGFTFPRRRARGSVSAPIPILDQLGVASAAAFSLRRLRAAHTGGAIRVRRSSDNAELDIGFATAVQTRTNLAAIPINNDGGSTPPGVTMTVTGTGTEFGQPYVEVRWQGTATVDFFLQWTHSPYGNFNSAVHAPIAAGLTYSVSFGYRLVAGTAPGGTWFRRALVWDANGSHPGTGHPTAVAPTPLSVLQRFAVIFTAPAGSSYTQPNLYVLITSGQVVDFTMRFYAANVELGTGNARPLLQRNVPEVVADIGDFDAEAVLNHCGTGNGFVPTRYDQSGNARNNTQTTAGSQPQIVSNGALETANGKPAIRFNGLNTFFFGISLSLSQFTLMSVLNDATQAPAIRYPIGTASASLGRGIFSSFTSFPSLNSLGYTPDALVTSPDVVQTGFLPPIGQSYVVSLTTTATESSIWANGGNGATGGRITLNELVIGQRGDGAWFYDGWESETIVLPSDLSTTDRQILERNPGAYYTVSVA